MARSFHSGLETQVSGADGLFEKPNTLKKNNINYNNSNLCMRS